MDTRKDHGGRRLRDVPGDAHLDRSLSLLSDGYDFIAARCWKYRSPVVVTRVLMERTLCIQGRAAAAFAYEDDRLTRKGAVPRTVLMQLQGPGSVQTLDGPAHRHRKAMFMSLMVPERRAALVRAAEAEWRHRSVDWEARPAIRLFSEFHEILCRAVCNWAGVPLAARDLPSAARQFAAMIEGSGSVGPRMWRGVLQRRQAERWVRRLIAAVRDGGEVVPEAPPLHVVAFHRGLDGRLLDTRTAAIELINVLRPVVAVSRFLVFVAMALHTHPQWRERLRRDEGRDVPNFVREVRRLYPFFPFIGMRAKHDVNWRGIDISAGMRVLFDIYGTNRSADIWNDPDIFRPDRFETEDPAAVVAQGAGDPHLGHRCPGEWVTLELMQAAARFLAGGISYDVPPQDLRTPLSRIPAIPESGFVISNVRRIA